MLARRGPGASPNPAQDRQVPGGARGRGLQRGPSPGVEAGRPSAGFALGAHDVYASVAGGLRVVEPAADLGIALAIASSFRNAAIPSSTAVFGELGLSGELRPVGGAERREGEARKLGYADVISPATASDIVSAIQTALG